MKVAGGTCERPGKGERGMVEECVTSGNSVLTWTDLETMAVAAVVDAAVGEGVEAFLQDVVVGGRGYAKRL